MRICHRISVIALLVILAISAIACGKTVTVTQTSLTQQNSSGVQESPRVQAFNIKTSFKFNTITQTTTYVDVYQRGSWFGSPPPSTPETWTYKINNGYTTVTYEPSFTTTTSTLFSTSYLFDSYTVQMDLINMGAPGFITVTVEIFSISTGKIIKSDWRELYLYSNERTNATFIFEHTGGISDDIDCKVNVLPSLK